MKRLFDITLSSAGIVLLSPIFLILSLLIFFDLGSPIIFKQERPGENGKLFTMLKFRTMKNESSLHGSQKEDQERLTRFGLFLRSTSLDELPELINVLKGEMSLVGPRPLLKEYLTLYNRFQKRRHEVKPGITGWAQINGRNAISWQEKFKLDVWYVENQSFLLDLKILLVTIKKVLFRENISLKNHATMEKFKGNIND